MDERPPGNVDIDREAFVGIDLPGQRWLDAGYDRLARYERALWIGVVVFLVGDVVLTLVGIRYGLAEGNPFVRAALVTTGVEGFVAMKLAALVTGLFYRRQCPRYGPAIAFGLALPWAVATTVNTVLIGATF